MKRILSLCLALIFSASLLPVRAFAAGEPPVVPSVISETAVLMDAETGQVLYQKEPTARVYPASVTKIMTALLVAENSSLVETARVSASAVDIDEWDSANIALRENEEMSIDGLMYAMMLRSANDASNVLAEHIAGSQDAFAAMMNARAESVGAMSTHYANAHGLHDPDHYTTAYDIALITREAINNEIFSRYFGASKRTIPPTNLNPYERSVINYQYMLLDTSDFYDPDVIGGKVGYTYEAEHTMSTVAERNGRTLICTVFKSPNRGDKFADTKKLLDFGFNEFAPIHVGHEALESFEEKIMNGENEEGVIYFRSADSFNALLHTSLDASALEISYSRPTAQGLENAGAYDDIYAEFHAETGNAAIPPLLGRVTLERSVVIYPSSGQRAMLGELMAMAREKPWTIPFTIFLAVFTIFLLFKLADKAVASIQEKKRQKRLVELQAAEEAQYCGPVPAVGKHFLIR